MIRIPEIRSVEKESSEPQITFCIDISDINHDEFSRFYHSLQNTLNELLKPHPFVKDTLTFDDVCIIKPSSMSGDLASAAARFNKRAVLRTDAKLRLKRSVSDKRTH